MAFQVSPGVNVSEIDLTTVVPAVAVSTGAIGGVFSWGPINKYLLIDSEDTLALRYGKPTADNYETWFTAANFLSYAQGLYVSRAANTSGANSSVSVMTAVALSANALTSSNTANMILNSEDYETKQSGIDTAVHFLARYPGALGNSLKVSVCDTAEGFGTTIDLFNYEAAANVSTGATRVPQDARIIINAATPAVANIFLTANTGSTGFVVNGAINEVLANNFVTNLSQNITVGDFIELTDINSNKQKLKVKSVSAVGSSGNTSTTLTKHFSVTFESPFTLVGVNTSVSISTTQFGKYWEYHNLVDTAPGQTDYTNTATGNTSINDEMHVVVVDQDGKFTGVAGQVLEVYKDLSRASDAKNYDGTTLYFRDVINELSEYVWVGKDITGLGTGLASSLSPNLNKSATSFSFTLGSDGPTEATTPVGDIARAYDLFKDAQNVDVGLVMAGPARGSTIANYLIDNIAEVRKDCVVFISPEKSDVYNVPTTAAQNIVDFRNLVRSSSYAVMDSGYKYQYDKYNDVYRWVPLNGDIAGIAARSDNIRDPWYSPAGYNRGIVKNLVKLAFNPSKTDRDLLYKNGINPVITQPGQGTVLFGDKTLLAKPSAFDRINVRRLFIVLEKTIANAANSTLFEFNDEFTRLQFLNLIEPFLRDVQGRRGITDFRVVCDETNNTPQVVDSNRFVGDIYIKPARSINFIQLNFVAVRSGVEFSEIVGQF